MILRPLFLFAFLFLCQSICAQKSISTPEYKILILGFQCNTYSFFQSDLNFFFQNGLSISTKSLAEKNDTINLTFNF